MWWAARSYIQLISTSAVQSVVLVGSGHVWKHPRFVTSENHDQIVSHRMLAFLFLRQWLHPSQRRPSQNALFVSDSLSEFLLWCTVFSVMMSTQLFGPCDENQHEQLPKARFWSLKSVSIDNVSSASAHTVGNDACSPREGVFSFELSQQSWGD